MPPPEPTPEPVETVAPSAPAEPPAAARPRDEGRWARLLMLLLALAVLAAAAGAIALLIGVLRSEGPSRGAAFAQSVTILDPSGAFEAATTNLGSGASTPTCRVGAFDIFGNRVGSKAFDLGLIPAGETLEWSDIVPVTGPVERMSIVCD